MSAAAIEYVKAGFALVELRHASKAPIHHSWQLRENAIATVEQAEKLNGSGVGLAHAWSGTCTFDIDDFDSATAWFNERNIDVPAMLMRDDAVQISSGRQGRAKLLFRLPPDIAPLTSLKRKNAAGDTAFELRCASADGRTLQDVLPPSIHPDTGKPYQWKGDWRNLPELPTELLSVWRELLTSKTQRGIAPLEPVSVTVDMVRDLRSALVGISSDDYETWVRLGLALKTIGDSGRELWFEWSTKSDKFDQANAERVWESFCPTAIDYKAVFSEAYKLGWRGSRDSVVRKHQHSIESVPRGIDITFRLMSDVQAKPIHWLWPGRIARGKVSMLAGNPGLGKSQITASMAAIVSTGGVWPVDRIHCERGNVVLLSAEDDAEDTIRPRLEAAGADLSRIYILDAVTTGYSGDGQVLQRAFNLQSDLNRLGELIDKIGGAALIVIDPITAYLGSSDSHKNAEIRALLAPLSDLAAKHSAAVVCVSHLNKSGSGEALMRVTGSLAFVAAARAAFLIAKDPENDTRRLFLPLKNNIGKDHTGLAFSLQSAQVKSTAGLIETSSVMWESEAVTVTADEAMVPLGDPEERGALDDAKDFLKGLLANGQVPSKQIRADAEGAGYSWRTIQRAQKALGIEAVKLSMKDGWVWKMPPKNANNTKERHANNVEAFDDLGFLRGDSEVVEVEI